MVVTIARLLPGVGSDCHDLADLVFYPPALLAHHAGGVQELVERESAPLESDKVIRHYDQHRKEEVEARDWLPSGKITIGVTAGASCPNNLIEDTIRRLFELRGISVQTLLAE